MAIQQAAASITIRDATGVSKAADFPFKFDDATATLANLMTWLSGLSVAVDAVTEGKVTKIRLILSVAIPGGLKANPVALSDVEETGLETWFAAGTPNAYGVDIPAFLQSAFIGGNINQANAAVTALNNYLSVPTNTIVGTDRYGNALTTVKTGVKTFRKSRRALRRA